ncbi:MAG: prepilin-type N-terminal cleavage/methylation domain-containing protein [Candidatus Spechtbacteria bacterium SB0662_bin_43]|uniref:Prepilin-type N-terminal cleavage/methylation domain-containing protein n=1 Tax=Candidatus Spechtbacteria bacterium SB0662_bin_43 TaxID=2604897 RepID=A0A845DI92_9BACT|nr:prepilin-type N-terminal cleavage/methylation domain-containing protein [Candidatus Spechtbacteria bacterium SB0662_bin_43]
MTGIHKSQHGFTLIELLISIAMATVMFGALGAVLINVISIQNHTLRKQEVLHNVRIITETMSRYMRLAEPYTTDNSQHHTNCVEEHSYFGGLDMSSSLNPQGVSAEQYIQFLSPIDQSFCMRFFLQDGVVKIGTIEQNAQQWEDYPLTAQEDVSVKLLEFQQGGTSNLSGHVPAITILIHAGIEDKSSQGNPQQTYEYLVKTHVGVAVRNLSPYPSPELGEKRVVGINHTKRTINSAPSKNKECLYDFNLTVDVDRIKDLYNKHYNIPLGHKCENAMALRLVVKGFTNQELTFNNEYQLNVVELPPGSGVQVFNFHQTGYMQSPWYLPCEASFFAVRAHPLNIDNAQACGDDKDKNGNYVGKIQSTRTFRHNNQYWTPYVLPLDA